MKCKKIIAACIGRRLFCLLLLPFLTPLPARGIETFPKPDWHDRLNPIASSEAVTGGEITIFAGQYPKSLN